MRRRGLADKRVQLPDGGTAVRYAVGEDAVIVRDDAETALTLLAKLKVGADPGDVCSLIFADLAEAFASCDYDEEELARTAVVALWDVLGIDVDGSHADETGGPRLWDPDEDADRIRASFRAAYGIDFTRDRRSIPWDEFLALVGGVPEETPLGVAMHYRNPRTRPKPLKRNANAEEIAAWDRAHALLALPENGADKKGSDKRLTDVFYSLAGRG